MSTSLLEKIKSDAALRVKQIEADAESRVDVIRRETAKLLENARTEAAHELEKEQAQQKLVISSKAKQSHKLAVQAAKREAINRVFADAFDRLSSLPATEYVKEYQTLYQETVPAGESVTGVTAPASRQSETADILKAVVVDVAPSFVDTITAGLIVRTESGAYDLTLDRRFSEARPELEMAVVAAAHS